MAALNIDLGLGSTSDSLFIAYLSRTLIEDGLGWTYRPQRVAALMREPETVTLVARARAEAVGFAVMRFGDERAHLVLLAVDPAHQRNGCARRMMDWLVKSARVAGMSSLHVELRASNAPALAFYRATGFSETFRVPGYYRGRETAVRMIRMLAAPRRDRTQA